jgi:endonuclease/exonuclease/phosphatase family metal-dependent hydrolase
MWDNSVFEVNSIEFVGQWISLCGMHIPSSFNCMIVSVYAASSVKERADLWEEIITLKFAFELPLVMLGDFNETLHANERSSGNLNLSGSTSFHRFISDCELVEFNMQGHRFTWFRGGSMSRIDRAFASPEFQL